MLTESDIRSLALHLAHCVWHGRAAGQGSPAAVATARRIILRGGFCPDGADVEQLLAIAEQVVFAPWRDQDPAELPWSPS